jgi:dUTP pyrophosphatase
VAPTNAPGVGLPIGPAHAAGRLGGSEVAAEVTEPAVAVAVTRLDPQLPMPSYAHDGDAGADLYAAVDVELKPGERALVRTGVAIALPPGFVGLVHPRSGLAAKLGVTVLNAPGTVDAGYRGEILVNLINHDPSQPAVIHRGDRIAQLVVQRVERADFREVTQLPPSARGSGGHGSTGGITVFGVAPAGDVAGVDEVGTAGTEDKK